MKPRELYMTYMRGWRHGAGTSALDPRFTEHTNVDVRNHYARGYGDGREACSVAGERASKMTGYKPSVLRLASTDPPSDGTPYRKGN